jgi:hypothetical protein
MSTPTLPYTAWEQAVFVALFVFLVLTLIGLLFNWFSKQATSWQKFIQGRDDAWQKFLKDQRAEDNAKIEKLATQNEAGFRTLTDAVAELARALAALTGDMHEHIADESAMLNAMLNEREKKRVAAARKQQPEK